MVLELAGTLCVGCFITYAYLAACRKKILKELMLRHATIVRIKWTPWRETFGATQQETRFEVQYKDSAGFFHIAVCRTRLFAEVFWEETQ